MRGLPRSRLRDRARELGQVALSLVAMSACGPPGDARFARLEVYDSPGGEYRVRFLAPPWQLIETDGSTARFEVESNASAVAGVPSGVVPPKYVLAVTVEPGRARARAEAALAQARARGHEVLVPVRAIDAEDGPERGFELVTRDDASPFRRFRTAFLGREGGGVVQLAFEGNPELDTPELDAMIAAVELSPGSADAGR